MIKLILFVSVSTFLSYYFGYHLGYKHGKAVEFVDVSRKTEFYSCGYQILPDDCEILTKEAYEDLCRRAVK